MQLKIFISCNTNDHLPVAVKTAVSLKSKWANNPNSYLFINRRGLKIAFYSTLGVKILKKNNNFKAVL